MRLSPDQKIFWQHGWIDLNLTIMTTWVLILILAVGSWLITRRLKSEITTTRWQSILEMLVTGMRGQIRDVGLHQPEKYIGFIGTVFLFIATANVCTILPGYEPPTGSLSTTAALAICVFIAVPFFGIRKSGLKQYLRSYLQPSFIMLPFTVISEISRTLALAVRLFGNIMSGGLIVAILLSIAPFFFPVVMSALGMLTGIVQAYIFAILATVYITAATQDESKKNKQKVINKKDI